MKYGFLISHLTLEEKASLLSGADMWHTKAIPAKGIPSILMTDGPHGLRKQVASRADVININNSVSATCFPTASALANSWDEAAVEKMGELLGIEAASEDISILLGPGVNIKRSPLCGRNFEYFSEDPFLSGKLAAALIRGIQSNGISACVKHFAANSQEFRRMSVDSVVDERTLREIYLPAFEIAVKEGGVRCVMTSYNQVNGQYANENTHLLKDILYGEWGYEGMVVSDWGGNNDRVASVQVGGTLEMPASGGVTDRQLVEAVREGRLEESVLDEQVDRLLTMIFSTRKTLDGKKVRYDRYKHHMYAAEMAAECSVLLKNEDNILPLDAGRTVAVIGDFADVPRFQGAGSSLVNAWNPLRPLDCLKSEHINIKGYAKGFNRSGKRSAKLMKEAVALARESDVVLLWLGLDEGGESEGVDRENLRLPDNQLNLLKVLAEVNQNIVVVLTCGGVLETDWDSACKGLVHGYLGGQASALALAELLSGKRNFSGKLSETMPVRYEDEPSAPWYPGTEKTAEYREGIYVGYRYFDKAHMPVKYPFGYGLSYTRFEYSNLRVEGKRVCFRVKNVGTVAGAEISQLYVSASTSGIFRPEKELKGFNRMFLQPGEEQEAEILLNDRSFAVWSTAVNGWVTEPGEYRILVGASCTDIRLGASVHKEGSAVVNLCADPIFAAYYTAETEQVSDGAFRALLGRELPERNWNRSAPASPNDIIAQGGYMKKGFGKLLYLAVTAYQNLLSVLGNREEANYVSFVLNMTYRGLSRYASLNERGAAALLAAVNGEQGAWKQLMDSIVNKRDKTK